MIITCRTHRKLRSEEINHESEKRKRSLFDDIITKKLGDSMSFPLKRKVTNHVPYEDDETDVPQLPLDNDPVDGKGQAIFEKPITDQ